MSDTPRTDNAIVAFTGQKPLGVSIPFARGLERELAQAKQQNERLRSALQKIADHNVHGWTLQTGVAREALSEPKP